MKRFLSMILAVAMVVLMIPFSSFVIYADDVEIEGTSNQAGTAQYFEGFSGCYSTECINVLNKNYILSRSMSFPVGGYNVDGGEIDGNTSTGVAGDWTTVNASNTYIDYIFDDNYFITSYTVVYKGWAMDAGFNICISDDAGESFMEVVTYKTDLEDVEQVVTKTFYPDSDMNACANAVRFEYINSMKSYECDLFEISATAYKKVECAWDEGVVTNPTCKSNMSVLYTCTLCNGTKKEQLADTKSPAHDYEDVSVITPATATTAGSKNVKCKYCTATAVVDIAPTGYHVWEATGENTATCTAEGIQAYDCTLCTATYNKLTPALGHIIIDTTVKTYPSSTKKGVMNTKCVRPGCTYVSMREIAKANIDENLFTLSNDNIASAVATATSDYSGTKADVNTVFDGITSGSFYGTSGYWCAPTGNTATFTFDREYLISVANLYVASNYNHLKVEFFDGNDTSVYTYSNGKLDYGASVTQIKISDGLHNQKVKKVVITIVGDKNAQGGALKIFEIQLKAHTCQYVDSLRTVLTPATCDTPGAYKNSCTICGIEQEFVMSTDEGHDYGALVTDTAPTCGLNGVGHKQCQTCTYVLNDVVIPATKEHTMELDTVYYPTCGDYGYGQYKCSVCSEKGALAPILPSEQHAWNAGTVIEAPTATETGTKELTCNVCGKETTVTVPSTGHTWDTGTLVPATCTEAGYTIYSCTDGGCSETYTDSYIAPLGHVFDNGTITAQASVDTYGIKTFKCIHQGCDVEKIQLLPKAKMSDNTFTLTDSEVDHYDTSTDPADYGAYATPNAIMDGVIAYDYWSRTKDSWYTTTGNSATVVLKNEYYMLDANIYVGSNYNSLTVEFYDKNNQLVSTYATSGLGINTGASSPSSVEPISLKDYVVDKNIKSIKIISTEAKFEDGSALRIYELELIAHECQYDEEEISITKSGTCYVRKEFTGTCYICHETKNVVGDYDHDYGNIIVTSEPTCVATGLGHYTCSKCGTDSKDYPVPATGLHDQKLDQVEKAPTCQNTGLSHKKCSVCGYLWPAYSTEATPDDHAWEVEVVKEATYTQEGLRERKCQYCGTKDSSYTLGGIAKTRVDNKVVTFTKYSLRYTDYFGIRATFKFDKTKVNGYENEGFTVQIKGIVEKPNDETVEQVIYETGKDKGLYNKKTGEFSLVIKGADLEEEYLCSVQVVLIDEDGNESTPVTVTGGKIAGSTKKTVSLYRLAEYTLEHDGEDLETDVKDYLEAILEQ